MVARCLSLANAAVEQAEVSNRKSVDKARQLRSPANLIYLSNYAAGLLTMPFEHCRRQHAYMPVLAVTWLRLQLLCLTSPSRAMRQSL